MQQYKKYPLASVIIPCLNRAHFLVPTIESVLQQDYPNIECIVIDGGSTDGTIEILKNYGNRIFWISEPDKGHANAINKGWKRSRGQILAWLNADDVLVAPNAVSQVMYYFRFHPEVDVVYGDCGTIDRKGKIVGMSHLREWNLEYAVLYCDHCIPQPSAFMRRSILEKVNWLDERFISKKDHELWLRIGLVGSIKHLPVILAHARNTPGYLAKRGDITAHACVDLTKKFFTLPNIPENIKKKQQRAISNAYLRGAQYAFVDGKHWLEIFNYICKAIKQDPKNIIGIIKFLLPLKVLKNKS